MIFDLKPQSSLLLSPSNDSKAYFSVLLQSGIMSSSTIKKYLARKRKNQSSSQIQTSKRVKTTHTVQDLPWKTLARPKISGLSGDDGILELEEVEGVEVVYEETEAGRVAKFKVLAEGVNDDVDSEKDAEEPSERVHKDVEMETEEPEVEEVVEDVPRWDCAELLPEWHSLSLHPKINMALHDKRFSAPTPIQKAAIPVALRGKDVVGVAQTVWGSGKTLAYGLPILNHLLSQPRPSASRKRPLRALVLAPTRELALQVSSHLNDLLTSIEFRKEDKTSDSEPSSSSAKPPAKKPPPHVSIAAIVGGMSSQKQRRILDRGVDILVATPGRLWDILGEDDELAQQAKELKYLVLDEADRMIEAGHFAELENILRLTLRETKDDIIEDDTNAPVDNEEAEDEDTEEGILEGDMQTFVFSATLSKDLQRNLKKRYKPKGSKKHYKKEHVPTSTLDDLLLRLDFRDPNPEVIDLSPVGGVVSTLQEGKIECLSADKDVYLYYFLLRYPGKSLVFLSSIGGIRRLLPLMTLLNINAFPLHSQLEQRQRLKNLDRQVSFPIHLMPMFKNTKNSVLLATDIAARGLDIPAVDHVIHFQIPRSADTYIHRNGRTARAMQKGFSMLMVSPDERRVVRALLNNVGRNEAEIAEMSIELSMLDKLKARVQLAKKIENAQHKVKKTNHDKNWMREAAETLGVDLDSDLDGSDEENLSKKKQKARDIKMAKMKDELKHMLSQPLLAKGILPKYITSGSRSIADEMLAGEINEAMLGLRKSEAGSEMEVQKKKKQSDKDTQERSVKKKAEKKKEKKAKKKVEVEVEKMDVDVSSDDEE
ncbi:P-loop containing nucleoside triphosphate hydrolase protein [Panaeolus papilionaceus]|nr:P-loop containing nucleoside triphosphate hydrolase protein [Panaeolus papilionaceus]